MNAEFGNSYVIHICYHVDKMLYLHVISLTDCSERRKYKVYIMNKGYNGEIDGEEYIKIPI